MLIVTATSFLVGVFGILLLRFAWGVPFRFFSLAIPIRHYVLTASATLLTGGLLLVFNIPRHIAGILALAVGLFIAFVLAFSRSEKRGLVLAMLRLRDPELGAEAKKLVLAKQIGRASCRERVYAPV